VAPFDWGDWAPSAALFLSDGPEVVRCASLGILGRALPEGPMTRHFRAEVERQADAEEPLTPRAWVARHAGTGAVVGVSAWKKHPLWPETCIVDVFSHPRFRRCGSDLLAALDLPGGSGHVSYVDAGTTVRSEIVAGMGYRQTASLPRRVKARAAGTNRVDVEVWEQPEEESK
jgi:hypothetical protein